jgi:radical SAM protein with 4Fe4S-binding SPASM domain
MGVKRFLATGGEPLLRQDLLDVLGYAKVCGLETGFSTNGSCISENNVKKIVTVADSIQVSVDGIAATHDRLRRSTGALSGALNALQLLKTHNCGQTCMTTIISPYNFSELEKLYSLAQENADVFRVGTVMPIGKAADNESLFLSDSQLRSLMEFLTGKTGESIPILVGENLGWLGYEYDAKILRQDFFFCGAGILSCCIGVDGRVRGCPELPAEGAFIAGDLRQERFHAIWEKGFLPYRDLEVSRLPPNCRKCPDIDLCRGGCRVMQLKGLHCTKNMLAPGSE